MEDKIKELNEKISNLEKETNIEELEPSTYILEKGKIYKENKMKEEAISTFKEVIEKSRSFNLKIEAIFEIMHFAITLQDISLLKEYLDLCEKKLNEGGDWEKRNRMRVYQGIYHVMNRDFKESGKLFLDALMTFTTYELFDYKTFVFYTSICNIITVNRNTLKTRIIDNSDVVSCIKDIPYLEDFLELFYNQQYNKFFEILLNVVAILKKDFYFAKHVGYFFREIKVKAYSQYLRKLKFKFKNLIKVLL